MGLDSQLAEMNNHEDNDTAACSKHNDDDCIEEMDMDKVLSDISKNEFDETMDTQGSLYSERSKKRRYKGKKEKAMKLGSTGRTWTKLEDPHAPRKPRSAYVHFLSSRRAAYGTVKQGCDQKKINVELAAAWQALSPEEREEYVNKASQERIEYQDAMIAYQQTQHFAAFSQKKELIMKQRKQCRKMGVESDSFIENLVLGMGTGQKERKNAKKKNAPFDMDFSVPTLINSDIPIFSKEFLDYNKERETQLRMIRRAIGVSEEEQNSMKKTIDRLNFNCDTLNTQSQEDDKTISETEATLNLWMQIASGALAKIDIPNGFNLSTPQETTDFLSSLTDTSGCPDVVQAVKEVLQNVSFLLPK